MKKRILSILLITAALFIPFSGMADNKDEIALIRCFLNTNNMPVTETAADADLISVYIEPDEEYFVNTIYWVRKDKDGYHDCTGENFEKNQVYGICIEFTANDGSHFADKVRPEIGSFDVTEAYVSEELVSVVCDIGTPKDCLKAVGKVCLTNDFSETDEYFIIADPDEIRAYTKEGFIFDEKTEYVLNDIPQITSYTTSCYACIVR